MNVYVFERIGKVSDREHKEGGLMLVAESEGRAKDIIADNSAEIEVTAEEWAEVLVIAAHEDTEECLITFPDAGCC